MFDKRYKESNNMIEDTTSLRQVSDIIRPNPCMGYTDCECQHPNNFKKIKHVEGKLLNVR